jgi:Haemolysin-III related
MQRDRLLGHRGAQPLDLLPRGGQLGLLRGHARPSRHRRRQGIQRPRFATRQGGLLYTAGALSYHRRWLDPYPAVFGYHEVFHVYVCAAVACQYVAIALFIA